MEEKDIKITINVGCLEKSRVKKEQIAGYLLRAIAGVTAITVLHAAERALRGGIKMIKEFLIGLQRVVKRMIRIYKDR